MILRILSVFMILFSIFFLPYWVYLPLTIVAIFYFRLFWEAVILGFIIDLLYRPETTSGLLVFPYALIGLVLVLVLLPLQDRLRFNA